MCKIFIDESAVHLRPEHIWTFCCLRGKEPELNKVYYALHSKMITQWPKLSEKNKLHYSELDTNQRQYAVAYLMKQALDFTVIYCDKETVSCFQGCNVDEMKRYMIQQLLLDRINKGHKFEVVYLDKSPLSKKSIKKLSRALKELGVADRVIPVPSRIKPALQIADILTGAARQYILNKCHAEMFDNNRDKILLLQEIYGVLKKTFHEKANNAVESICFKF